MAFPFFIAGRYLFAKKSHNVINVVSAISAAGIAIGTAALIIILSVFNGFNDLISAMLSPIEPDLAVMPAEGKFFAPDGPTLSELQAAPDSGLFASRNIQSVCKILQDNVFLSYYDRQGTAFVKGVEDKYIVSPSFCTTVKEGPLQLRKEEIPYAFVGSGFAARMGVNVNFVEAFTLYYPDRDEHVSLANPMSSVNMVKVFPKSRFALFNDADNTLVLIGLDCMRELTGCQTQLSALEIRFKEGTSASEISSFKSEVQDALNAEGMHLTVKDRYEQNPDMYRMMRMEKASIYMILLFVVIILGFSIFGSLSLLLIEKKNDIFTLRAMGADRKEIRRIFTLEGWFITLSGMLAGLALGIIFCLLQQHVGLIRMPGTYIVDYYPVRLDALDAIIATAGISVSGWVIARLSTRLV